MYIYPAVDIIGGKVVRLLRGDYDQVTTYSLSVEEAALNFQSCGAKHLHAVDLDGAKSGRCDNAQSVKRILSATGLFVEIGGGIRTEEQIVNYLNAGADRVILGTVAVRDFAFVERMAQKYGKKIAVGVDAAEGKVAVSGWREVTEVEAVGFCKKLADVGVQSVIYTDISRDGAMQGTNLAVYRELVKISGLKITASGGVTTLAEIRELKESGVYAAVLGRALYEGAIDLAEAIAAAES